MTDHHKKKTYVLDKMHHFNLVIYLKHAFDSILPKYLQYINTGVLRYSPKNSA